LSPGNKHDPESCHALNDLLSRIGDKWTVLVVGTLCGSGGPTRFNELRRSIDGISQRMLTLTLRGLERDGLVTRTIYPTIPPRVEYELTPLGRTLREPLGTLAEWAKANRGTVAKARESFDAKEKKALRSTPARLSQASSAAASATARR
jgi:DNA-binding HxlR family transcriptional regulator